MATPRGSSLYDLEGAREADERGTSVLDATLRVHRRTPIERLGTEALRFLLEEGGATDVLLRVAIDRLERDPLQAGDFYPGDLLASLLRQPEGVWLAAPELRARAYALMQDASDQLGGLEPADRTIVARAIASFMGRWKTGGPSY